ncbi:hypothetical protein Ndes2526B_g06633 [Nannochloris sp. 'desiccata']|nr:hypothetical protein KSW81_008360 [Chlorella desiccata (nom. nud.)]KAH7619651.1 hypothetical protein NADE_006484 [Chlorella desiccata (nom. nud.)]
MQTTASIMRAQPLMAKATPNAARKNVVVRASMTENEMPRRAALALAAAAVIGLSVDAAQAVTAAKSASSASQDGYDMEGTKKMGITRGRKNKILAKVRANAAKNSAQGAPAASE